MQQKPTIRLKPPSLEGRPETHAPETARAPVRQCTTNLGTENQHLRRRCNCPLPIIHCLCLCYCHQPPTYSVLSVATHPSIHTEFLTSFHSQHHPSSRPSSAVSLELRRLASPHLSFSSQHQHCLASPPSSFDSCACVTDFRVPPCPTSDLHHSTPQIAFRPASTRLDSIRLTTFLTAQALPCSPTLLTITLSLRFRVSETVYDLLKHKSLKLLAIIVPTTPVVKRSSKLLSNTHSQSLLSFMLVV